MKIKHIGIVACSGEGAALCYRTIVTEGADRFGRHEHPEISMHTYSLRHYMELIDRDDWEAVGRLMLDSGAKCAQNGADVLICPDNTVHQGLDMVVGESTLPWLHIAEQVALEAKSRGYKRVGVTGTRFLMEGPVYASKLAQHGIDQVIPEPDERERINDIIFDELVNGRFDEPAREYFRQAIRRLAARGCEAVVLGCTEIPILIAPADSTLPTLDSTRILARAALAYAGGERRAPVS